MKKTSIILSLVLTMVAGIVLANSVSDIELTVSPGSNATATATASGVNGWVNSVAIDTVASSTGDVTVAIQPSPSTLDARTIVSTNEITSDKWLDPSDGASRRYAITDKDTISVTVSNYTATAKQYRAVIRVESAK